MPLLLKTHLSGIKWSKLFVLGLISDTGNHHCLCCWRGYDYSTLPTLPYEGTLCVQSVSALILQLCSCLDWQSKLYRTSLSLQICWLSWKIITHCVIIEANSRKLCRRILDVNDNSPINSLSFSDLCVCVLVAQSRPKFCDPRDCSLPGSSVHEFSTQEYWSGKPFPSPGDLPDPGIEPRFPSLQADLSHQTCIAII